MARIKRDPNSEPIAEKIQEAATLLFSQYGFESTSMKQIAEAADVTPAAIYYHYANKQDILYRGLKNAITSLTHACLPAMAHVDKNPSRSLSKFVSCHVLFQLKDLSTVATNYTALVYGAKRRENLLSPTQRDNLIALERAHLENLKLIIKSGLKAGTFSTKDATAAAFAIIGMCEHSVNWARPDGRLSNSSIAKVLAGYALNMVRAVKSQTGIAKHVSPLPAEPEIEA